MEPRLDEDVVFGFVCFLSWASFPTNLILDRYAQRQRENKGGKGPGKKGNRQNHTKTYENPNYNKKQKLRIETEKWTRHDSNPQFLSFLFVVVGF